MANSPSLAHPKRINPNNIQQRYRELFHAEPVMFRSPGRINLIGEHTDYNDGYVMPAGIDREMVFAIGKAQGTMATLHSARNNETVTFDVANPHRVDAPLWANYMLGVARRFIDKGYTLQAFNCVMDGDIPTGAGLSSSAALECGFAFALDSIHGFGVGRIDLVHIAQWSEHHYAGVLCGIMDQFASMMGKKDQAFRLDCRSLAYEYFTIPLGKHVIVLCDTMVKHTLASSAYNERRQQCEEGVRILQQHFPEVNSLRDVNMEMLTAHRAELPGKIWDRCQYVVEENQRVLDASKDLAAADLAAFGQKMFASHDGLSTLYEVSCDELDYLVVLARNDSSVAGARMMGGGFGGCTINIVLESEVSAFVSRLAREYKMRFNTDMDHYVVSLQDGTSVLEVH